MLKKLMAVLMLFGFSLAVLPGCGGTPPKDKDKAPAPAATDKDKDKDKPKT